MFIKDDFIIDIDFYRTNEENTISPATSTEDNIVSTSTRNTEQDITTTATWNTLICLYGSPESNNNDLDYIAVNISISSKWTSDTYNLLYTNNKPIPLQSSEFANYQGADSIMTHFAIGQIIVKYWQSCDTACNDKFGPCWDRDQDQLLQKDFPLYVGLILIIIFIIILIMLFTAYINYKYYYKC